MQRFKKDDRVRGTNSRYPSFTGKVIEPFYGFAKVLVDQPSSLDPIIVISDKDIELENPSAPVPPPLIPPPAAHNFPVTPQVELPPINATESAPAPVVPDSTPEE